jgi:hypothetical protein
MATTSQLKPKAFIDPSKSRIRRAFDDFVETLGEGVPIITVVATGVIEAGLCGVVFAVDVSITTGSVGVLGVFSTSPTSVQKPKKFEVKPW